MIRRSHFIGLAALALAATFSVVACHKEEQAVVGVAQTARQAEQKAQASATERDRERAQLEAIPLPTKSMYVDVREPAEWNNPFLSVGPNAITLRIVQADANPSSIGAGTMLRPAAARRQEVQLRPEELVKAVVAIPPSAWHYGRVIAIAEAPAAPHDRPKVRRNVETAIQQLNDLGIVVDEWPGR